MNPETCTGLLEYWANIFKDERQPFGVRCVKTGKVWRNDAARKIFYAQSNFGVWGDGTTRVKILNDGDVQDAQSRAFKLRTPQFCTMLLSDGSTHTLTTRTKSCDECPTACRVLVYCAVARRTVAHLPT